MGELGELVVYSAEGVALRFHITRLVPALLGLELRAEATVLHPVDLTSAQHWTYTVLSPTAGPAWVGSVHGLAFAARGLWPGRSVVHLQARLVLDGSMDLMAERLEVDHG